MLCSRHCSSSIFSIERLELHRTDGACRHICRVLRKCQTWSVYNVYRRCFTCKIVVPYWITIYRVSKISNRIMPFCINVVTNKNFAAMALAWTLRQHNKPVLLHSASFIFGEKVNRYTICHIIAHQWALNARPGFIVCTMLWFNFQSISPNQNVFHSSIGFIKQMHKPFVWKCNNDMGSSSVQNLYHFDASFQ